jgi:hypothetical protein
MLIVLPNRDCARIEIEEPMWSQSRTEIAEPRLHRP